MKLAKALTILDKPKHTQSALLRAVALQAQSKCHLDLVSFCWHSMGEASEAFEKHQLRSIRDEIINQRREWQRDLLVEHGCSMRNVSLRTIWTDNIAAWVAKRTATRSYDLLIKSIHHSKTWLHTPLDWAILSSCTAPMLFTTARQTSAKKGGSVLAALDMRRNDQRHTKLNRRVLARAYEMAQLHGADLHCVVAIEISPVLRDLDIIDQRSAKKRIVSGFQADLDKLVEHYAIPKSRIHLPVGKVGQVVTQQAQKINARLLVIGTLAHPTKQALGLGNSAQKIISRSTVSLLAIPQG